MNNYQKTLTLSVLTIGLINSLSPITNAQNTINRQQNQPFQTNERNPLYGDGINPLDLIHNANLLNNRSGSDFAEETKQNINSAAENFKRQQQQRILEMQQKQNTAVENQETNPLKN